MAYVGQNPKFNTETLRPQSADPSNPGEGMIFRADGTSRAKGIWEYRDGNWQNIGSGTTQYLPNPNLDNNVTGWATYADAAAAIPVDGTGGSPNITFASSSTTPLRGAGSGLLTKDAANRQGQGISTDFTIDTADKGKVLQGYFEYQNVSGTYATGDLTIWIYDKTNAVIIPCTPYQIQNSGLIERQPFEFQTSISSTSYRLIIHVSTTSASAYSLRFDTFNVANNAKLYGSPVTDWNTFTPTSTWVSNVTHTGQWRRVGDSMEVRVNMAMTGTPTNVALDINLPSGYSIDTAKVSGFSQFKVPLGVVVGWDGGANYPFEVTYSDSATKVRILSINASSTYAQGNNLNASTPFSWASGTNINANFIVPIVGWGSTVQMSDSADTRVVAASANQQTPTGTLNGSSNIIVFGTIASDTHAAYNTSTGLYTVPVAGYYQARATVETSITYPSAQTLTRMGVGRNGTVVSWDAYMSYAASSQFSSVSPAAVVFCNAGDTLGFYSLTNGSAPSFTNAQSGSSFSIQRVSGPSQIAASEKIYARYETNVTTSVANTGDTLIDFEDKVFDSHNAVTVGASWKFTAPVAGIYQISSNNQFTSATYAVGNVVGGAIYKNGSVNTYFNSQTAAAATGLIFTTNCPSILISLNAGDYIDIRLTNTRTAGATTINGTAASNYICIEKI